jgi:hypothetical protein
MGTIKTTNIEPIADNGTVTLGSSGDTFTLGSGVKQSNLMYPAFEAYRSSAQTVSDATVTKVQYDTETFDTDNCYDNSTNYRFTPTVAGKYFVYVSIQAASSVANDIKQVQIQLYKNGSIYRQSRQINDPSETNWQIIHTQAIIDMNGSTDYLEVFGYIDKIQSSTISFTSGTKNTYFGAYRIGD